jgi:predicted  nucleic acid-binding Zn-ribbon protein
MFPRPSVIQKCPHCGKYYFASNVETKEGDDCSGDLGELTYEQIKEALTQFDKDWLSADDEIELRLLFVHIYNDTFQREAVAKEETPTSEDKNLFEKQVLRLLQIWKTEPLLKAEFYREIGDFSQCIQILDSQRESDPFKEKIASKVRMLAERHETYAFVIEN